MAYDIMTVRTAEACDGRLYPVLGDGPNLVEFEPDDRQISPLYARSIIVRLRDGSSLRDILRVQDIQAQVLISDARVIVACEKYTKEGGGWIGFGGAGVAIALTANAVGKARAAHRRKGKALVGHVRYRWLRSVGCTLHHDRNTSGFVRIGLTDFEKRTLFLDLGLAKGVDPALVAQDIAHRTARYRLEHDGAGMTGEVYGTYTALSNAGPLQPNTAKYMFYEMPTFRVAAASSAYPKLAAHS